MKKWYDEEYEFQVEVIGYLRGDHTEHLCRNGEEIAIHTAVHTAARSTPTAMEFAARP